MSVRMRARSIQVIETHRRCSLFSPDKDFESQISQQGQQKQQAGIAKQRFHGGVLFGLNCASLSFPPAIPLKEMEMKGGQGASRSG